ncbi:hypothetical protein [Rhizobium leguminosarum]|nr:hypothetical protein [Rhizobium leguminosarum]MBY2946876.1 hypothetical protein [Rhizobium leguminosarum]MBY2988189.1 hypothetical protein [Rhizobium leguminosarum]
MANPRDGVTSFASRLHATAMACSAGPTIAIAPAERLTRKTGQTELQA